MKTTSLPCWAQWVLGIFIAIICLGAGLASMGMNVKFGLQFSPIMGAIFGLSDVLKVSLPAVAIVAGWQWQTKTLYYGAAVFSIFCALNYLAETQGNTLLETKHRNAMLKDAKIEMDAAHQQIAKIDELLGSTELTKLHQQKMNAVSRETERGGCGPKCEILQREADALLDRLGNAKRRENLEAQAENAARMLKASPEKTVGSVGIIAELTGVGKEQIGTGFTIISSIFAIALLELAAMLSSNAIVVLRSASGAKKKKPARSAKTSSDVKAEEPTKMTKEIALEKVQLKIFHSPGRMLICSRRALAEELGVAKSTFNDWCNQWEKNGSVITRKRGNDTEFEAAA